MTEYERLEAANKAISEALEKYGVCFAWEFTEDGEMWLEIDDDLPPQPRPELKVVS